MTDLFASLAEARPATTELDRMWAPDRREDLLERLQHPDQRLDSAAVGRRPRRGLRLLAVAATVVLAVPIGHEVLSPDAAQAHADLRALAAVAADGGGPVLAPGQFLHVRTESLEDNRWPYQNGADWDTNRESWIGWDGTIWAIDSRPSAGWRDYMHFAAAGTPTLNQPTPEFAATLPHDSTEFRAYLEDHVSGSNSHEEALFVAVTDLIHSNVLPPAVLGAALGALADLDGVRTQDVSLEGRDAVEISYRRFGVALLSDQSLVVDRATARPLTEADRNPLGSYESSTTSVEVVYQIPVDVRAVFETHPEGVRLCADGKPAIDEGQCQ
jgi:hypothetical protein